VVRGAEGIDATNHPGSSTFIHPGGAGTPPSSAD
jgi:hypothetical protein